MKKNVSILGSTGSIGVTSLKIFNRKNNLFKINILAANKNYRLICKQINQFKPEIFVINDSKVLEKVKKKFKNNKVKIIKDIDIRKNLYELNQQAIEDQLVPFGIIDDGNVDDEWQEDDEFKGGKRVTVEGWDFEKESLF